MKQQLLHAKGSLDPENVEEEIEESLKDHGSNHADDDPKETEDFDVEKVLKMQNTYDLVCPNCRSCITTTVILCRKGSTIIPNQPSSEIPTLTPQPQREVPPGKPTEAESSNAAPSQNDADIPTDHPATPGADRNRNNGCQEVFKCLSCFSYFIPTGNCLKLFEIFEGNQDARVTGQGEAVSPSVVIPIPEYPPTIQDQDTRDWGIIKSIVYGGLVESITSLGVVSSAAGGGAKTLNTLALGLANLITGLFVIANNLRELKKSSVTSSGSSVQHRYFEQLGRRDKFCLHATIVIISFIIFGSVAPITYAFSFRESDNRDYKLAVVAAASLFCIVMLAIGKAHVRTPPRSYFKTISYYVITGLTASGVSFLVGELLDYLLEKLGWFDSSSSVTSSVTGAIVGLGTETSKWASY